MNRPFTPSLTRRSVLSMAAGSSAALALSACSGKPTGSADASQGGTSYHGPPVNLTFWNGFTGGDGPIMQELVSAFNDAHDNITVQMTVYEWESYNEKLPPAVNSGKAPDIGIMHIDSLATNAARGVIIPIDDVAEALELSEDDFISEVWNAGVYRGERYGIPLDVHPLGNFYNKTLLDSAGLDPEKPPRTGDELADALDALRKNDIEGLWMSPFPFTGSQTFYSLLWQFGGDLLTKDNQAPGFAEDAGVKALTWMADLVKDGHSAANIGQDSDFIAFQNDETAFNFNGIWSLNLLADAKDLEWGVAPIPQIGDVPAVWAGSHNFVLLQQLNPDSDRLSAAKVFVNWISGQSLEWAKGGQVPARDSVRESEEFADLTDPATFAQQVEYVRFPPVVPGLGDVIPQVDEAVNEAMLLRMTPADALAAGADKAAKILDENREKYG